MAFRIAQAVFPVLTLVLLLTAPMALAKTPLNERTAPPPAATTATIQSDPVDVGDLLTGLGDMLPGMAPDHTSGDTFPEKNAPVFPVHAPDDEATKNDTAKDDAVKNGRAKSDDSAPVKKDTSKPASSAPDKAAKAASAPPPYKVYASPRIADDAPQPATANPDAPIKPVIIPSPASPEGQTDTTDMNASGPPAPPPVAVAAFGNRFFPILPQDTPPDTPPWLVPVATNLNLDESLDTVTRAIVVIHDITRNAAENLAAIVTLAGSDNGATLVLAPQFPLALDIARFARRLPNGGANVARWPLAAGRGGWQIGGISEPASDTAGVSSFSVMDLLLLYLADRTRFPTLQTIVVAGHGAGGDFVLRYAATGQAPEVLNKQAVSLRFVAANPSSFVYFTTPRPLPGNGGFAVADDPSCPDVNAWPYGLDQLGGYARRVGKNAIRMRFPNRWLMVLTGDAIDADSFLDVGCAAMAEGQNRLDRATSYQRYLDLSFGTDRRAPQSFITVGNAGYDPVAMFGSYCGMVALFGDGHCDTPTE